MENSSEPVINQYISDCCGAFIIFDGISCICSVCEKSITVIKNSPTIIGIKFNDSSEENISGSLIVNYINIAKRFATDPTYELCSQKCPKCKNLSRYSRNVQDKLIFICSNSECRNVF